MISICLRDRGLLLITLILLTSRAPILAEGIGYAGRLRLPVAEDDIGYAEAVAADLHTGEIFVCDSRRSRILIFDSKGYFKHQIVGGLDSFNAPTDLALDPDGLMVVIAYRGQRQVPIEMDFDGLFLREITLKLDGDPQEVGQFSSVALSTDGARLYLVDATRKALWIAERSGEVEKIVDLAAGLSDTEKLDLRVARVDVYGDHVLVALPSLGLIRLFTPTGDRIADVGTKGTSYCKNGRPMAAAMNKSGEIYVIDQQRMVILQWQVEENKCLGQYASIGISQGALYYPSDISLDGQGRLYVSQSFEGRVQFYEGSQPAKGIPTDAN